MQKNKCVFYIWLITVKHCWTAVVFIIILGRPGLSFQSGSGLSRTGSPFFSAWSYAAQMPPAHFLMGLCSSVLFTQTSPNRPTLLSHIIQFILPGHFAHYWESSACHRLICIHMRMFSFFSEYDFFNSEHDSKNMALRNQNHHEPRNRCSHSNKHTVHLTFPLFSLYFNYFQVVS